MRLRCGKLLGERVNGGIAVRCNILGVSHQWESTGYMAQESFQTALGHAFDQNNDPIDLSSGRTWTEEYHAKQLDYKRRKVVREQRKAAESNQREESRIQEEIRGTRPQ